MFSLKGKQHRAKQSILPLVNNVVKEKLSFGHDISHITTTGFSPLSVMQDNRSSAQWHSDPLVFTASKYLSCGFPVGIPVHCPPQGFDSCKRKQRQLDLYCRTLIKN